jgi:hypothetical protein
LKIYKKIQNNSKTHSKDGFKRKMKEYHTWYLNIYTKISEGLLRKTKGLLLLVFWDLVIVEMS